MKVTFTVDVPQKDFENLCKKMKMNKPHKIPNFLKGKKGVITDMTYYGLGLTGGSREGEMTIVILDESKIKQK